MADATTRSLAFRLRDARTTAILSQAELAAILGVSRRAIQTWEAGTQPLPRHHRALLDFIAEHETAAA